MYKRSFVMFQLLIKSKNTYGRYVSSVEIRVCYTNNTFCRLHRKWYQVSTAALNLPDLLQPKSHKSHYLQ